MTRLLLFKKTVLAVLFSLAAFNSNAQSLYYPDTAWQVKKPEELKMNAALLDSAVRLAMASENKMERDLRIANMKAYASEPDYKIIGPMKQRGGPAGLVIKNGYIVAQWGDIQPGGYDIQRYQKLFVDHGRFSG